MAFPDMYNHLLLIVGCSVAADLLHIAQSMWAFVTTENNLECRGNTRTFFAGTNFAFRTTGGKYNVRQYLCCFIHSATNAFKTGSGIILFPFED